MTSIHRYLQFKSARKIEHLYFSLLDFRFFKDSERGVALFFGNHWLSSCFVVMPYILISQLILFRARRYFVKLKGNVVGVVVFHEEPDNLFIASLGVAKEYRRVGVATCILRYAESMAARLGKERLELGVLKRNTPAQRLYMKFGFSAVMERRWSFILRKRV